MLPPKHPKEGKHGHLTCCCFAPTHIPIEGSNILGDKDYGTKAIRQYIDEHTVEYTIPPKNNDLDRDIWYHFRQFLRNL